MGSCGASARGPAHASTTDLAITVEMTPDPLSLERTRFRIRVTRGGARVTGAQVCLIADMPGIAMPAVPAQATQTSPGSYEASVRFPIGGDWDGVVLVGDPGEPLMVKPISFDVAS